MKIAFISVGQFIFYFIGWIFFPGVK